MSGAAYLGATVGGGRTGHPVPNRPAGRSVAVGWPVRRWPESWSTLADPGLGGDPDPGADGAAGRRRSPEVRALGGTGSLAALVGASQAAHPHREVVLHNLAH